MTGYKEYVAAMLDALEDDIRAGKVIIITAGCDVPRFDPQTMVKPEARVIEQSTGISRGKGKYKKDWEK